MNDFHDVIYLHKLLNLFRESKRLHSYSIVGVNTNTIKFAIEKEYVQHSTSLWKIQDKGIAKRNELDWYGYKLYILQHLYESDRSCTFDKLFEFMLLFTDSNTILLYLADMLRANWINIDYPLIILQDKGMEFSFKF